MNTPQDITPPNPLPTEAPDWSVVVPAYNEVESGRLMPTLGALERHFEERALRCEILVVDDASTDGTAEALRREAPAVRVLSNETNRGKGYCVRRGLLEARGRHVLFTDADLSTPIEELDRFAPYFEAGADLVIGSRAMRESVLERRQPLWREASGRIFNHLVRLSAGLPFHDTQCGFKAYRREAAHRLAGLQRLERWAFDVEHLYLARRLGYDVREVPVRWINSPDSRVSLLRDAPRMLLDTLRVRFGRYDLTPSGEAGRE